MQTTAIQSFESNVAAVERLLGFDQDIVEVAVEGLRQIERALDRQHLHSLVQIAQRRATLLENIRESGSLRPQYEAIFNQCVVLLVSYFGSALHTLFRDALTAALAANADVPASKEKLQVSWRTIEESGNERGQMFAQLLIDDQKISFQDMQSVSRAFQKNMKIDVTRTSNTNDIIVGQAARHAIAHAAGITDRQMINQLAQAFPRKLKPTLVEGDLLKFSPEEVRTLAKSMSDYLNALLVSVQCASADWPNATSLSSPEPAP